VLAILGFGVGVVGLLLALWAEVKRRDSERRSAERSQEQVDQLSSQEEYLKRLLDFFGVETRPTNRGEPLGASEQRSYAIGIADVNNDGRDELLVATPYGPHSSLLQVFGQVGEWPESFGKLIELGSGTPAGFTVGDLDGDGATEIATIEPDLGAAYALGHRIEKLYRWNDGEFIEVGSRAVPAPGEPGGFGDPASEMRWNDGWSTLTVK
jgi:hypothetical protein